MGQLQRCVIIADHLSLHRMLTDVYAYITGAWVIHPVLVIFGKVLVDVIPGMHQDASWTIVNLTYLLVRPLSLQRFMQFGMIEILIISYRYHTSCSTG